MSLPDRLRTLLSEFVAFDTQNPSGDEGALARWLETRLGALGAARCEAFAAAGCRACPEAPWTCSSGRRPPCCRPPESTP
jgi:hypothetical protein